MPLDEITAPYNVSNFITVLDVQSSTTMDKLVVIAPRTQKPQSIYTGPLTDIIAMVYDGADTVNSDMKVLQVARAPILGPSITPPILPVISTTEPAPDNDEDTEVRGRLHNMSVRLECLGTNTGLYPPGSAYIGTVPNIEAGYHSVKKGQSIKSVWADDSVQSGLLQSMPAARLVEHPTEVHASICENVSFKTWRDFRRHPIASSTTATSDGHLYASDDAGAMPILTSLEPILIYIPRCGAGSTRVDYRVVIGQEWCTRHAHNVLLRSTAKQHSATPSSVYQNAINAVKTHGPALAEFAGGAIMGAVRDYASRSEGAALVAL